MKRSSHEQHYLFTAKARSFSLMDIARLSDDEAWRFFNEARWPEGVACPKCDHKEHYWLGTRKPWRCKC